MDNFNLYNDIACRTNGDIYVGVVGPVRTGKSTFIKRMMDLVVLPRIEDKNVLARATDELPQSADGKTVMTTQPKFVPAEAVEVTFDGSMRARIRMIDCVGYMVTGALGGEEGDKTRMVKTPWSDTEMPFEQAAEMGTRKVIRDHSTIGIVVTSDGSVTDIARGNYVDAEQRVVQELKASGKPFAVVLNTRDPSSPDTLKLREALEDRYGVAVIAKNVSTMTEQDIAEIMGQTLLEFGVTQIDAALPKWMAALNKDHPLIAGCIRSLADQCAGIEKMRDAMRLSTQSDSDDLQISSTDCDMGKGIVTLHYTVRPDLLYRTISDCCQKEITDEFALLSYIVTLSNDALYVAKLRKALEAVETDGYGVVEPSVDEMVLEEPEIMRQSGRFGVRLKASAPSLHIMKVDVTTEVNPIVGSEQQSEELVKYLLSEFETNKKGIWQTNMFGKSLSSLVNEGLNNKLMAIPKDAPAKMRKTLGRIINEGKGGMICILL